MYVKCHSFERLYGALHLMKRHINSLRHITLVIVVLDSVHKHALKKPCALPSKYLMSHYSYTLKLNCFVIWWNRHLVKSAHLGRWWYSRIDLTCTLYFLIFIWLIRIKYIKFNQCNFQSGVMLPSRTDHSKCHPRQHNQAGALFLHGSSLMGDDGHPCIHPLPLQIHNTLETQPWWMGGGHRIHSHNKSCLPSHGFCNLHSLED